MNATPNTRLIYRSAIPRASRTTRRRSLIRIGGATLLIAAAGALLGRGMVTHRSVEPATVSVAAPRSAGPADQADIRAGAQQAVRTAPAATPAPLSGSLIAANGTVISLRPVTR